MARASAGGVHLRGSRGRAFVGSLALATAVGATAGCQTPAPPSPSASVSPAPVWPPGAGPARIRWLAEVRGPADLGIQPGRLTRLWRWISGSETPRLVRPHGVAVDARGRLWVADPGARLVHVFDPVRRKYTTIPKRGDAPLLSPVAVTHDGRGTAYVTDSAAGLIRRFDPDGRALGDWGRGELVRPTGAAFDSQAGLLWVVDTGSHKLVVYDEQGHIDRNVGERGSGVGRFNFPTHLTIDPGGRLFVTDTLNFRVQVLSPMGEPLFAFGEAGDGPGALSKPKGVALDRDGHVYVVDGMFDNVQIFDQEGRVLLHFGERGAGPGQFWLPAGLCIAAGSRIYVADGYNQRVQVFEYLGE